MLRIKENVDLKELENFGFEKTNSVVDGKYYYVYEELLINENKEFVIFKIREKATEKIFDLAQAGLVEKGEK